MPIKQISIFVENKPGRLADITSLVAEKGIDIRALSIADTTDYGILRLIVNDPEKAEAALKDSGLTVSMTNVLGHRASRMSRAGFPGQFVCWQMRVSVWNMPMPSLPQRLVRHM